MTSTARRLHALLLRPGRAEGVGLLVGMWLFAAILRFAGRADDAISPPTFVAASLFAFLLLPKLAREIVAACSRAAAPTQTSPMKTR